MIRLGGLIDNSTTLPAVPDGPIHMDLPIQTSFILNDPTCLQLFILATQAVGGLILCVGVVVDTGPPTPASSVSAMGHMSLAMALAVSKDGDPLPPDITGNRGLRGGTSFASVAIVSICGAMLCHEFKISTMDP